LVRKLEQENAARRAKGSLSISRLGEQAQYLSASAITSAPTSEVYSLDYWKLTFQSIEAMRQELSKVMDSEAQLRASIYQQQADEIRMLKEKIQEQDSTIQQINEELKVNCNPLPFFTDVGTRSLSKRATFCQCFGRF
jgi:hypothetical protein